MVEINAEIDALMSKAIEDLRKPTTFLAGVRQNIIRCYQIEHKAFEKLNNIIKQ